MLFETWMAFTLLVAVLAVSPGPSVLLVVSHALRHGSLRTTATICGDLTANVLQMFAAWLGIASVLAVWPSALEAVQWLGVAYLTWVGVSKLVRASRRSGTDDVPAELELLSRRRLFIAGFTVSALNPKAVLFFAGLFPSFLDPDAAQLPQLAALGLTYVLLDGTALLVYALLSSRLARHLEHHRSALDQLAGALIVVAACIMAARQL